MNIQIVDSGKLPTTGQMREWFEAVMRDTATVKKHTKPEPKLNDGQFVGYADPETDAMWVGFAVGQRMAVRFLKAGRGEALLQ